MKAIAYHQYGSPDVLHCEDVAIPTPGDDQVLLHVHAASLNAMDAGLLKGKPFPIRILLGFPKPKVSCPGRDVAGVVKAVGKNVSRFKPGDEVFGVCSGKSWMDKADGACAEYARTTPSALALKPPNVTFEQAASLPIAGLTALQGLRDKGRIQPEQSVLVHGAGGGVGTFAVQIAKALGASVTAVTSPAHLDRLRSLGADRVVDYTREDFTRTHFRYDIVFDCYTSHSLLAAGRVLKPSGRYIAIGGSTGNSFRSLIGMLAALFIVLLSPFSKRKLVLFMAKVRAQDLDLLADLVASGKVTPAIDRTYPLDQVPEAFRYFEQHQVHGKIVITVS